MGKHTGKTLSMIRLNAKRKKKMSDYKQCESEDLQGLNLLFNYFEKTFGMHVYPG